MNSQDTKITVMIIIAAIIIVPILLFAFADFISNFSRELQYLNCEINRSVGKERKYWLRQRRRLWLSLIPFVKY